MNLKFKKESQLTNKTGQKRFKIGQTLTDKNTTQQKKQKVTYWNWQQKGAITPVRQQGMCGACWAFASTAIIESDFYIKTKVILDLSEEYIVQCVGGDNDCAGGYFEDAYLFLKKKGGLPLESRYPYKAGALSRLVPNTADICNTTRLVQFKKDSEGKIDFQISYYDHATNQQLEELLLQYPLSTHFASNAKFSQYRGGIFICNQTVQESNINHGVQIVGFNSTGRYFIVKNSWGNKWGMDGFGYVSYDGDCGMRIRVFSFEQHLPITKIPTEPGQRNLEYEPLPLELENYQPLPLEKIVIETHETNNPVLTFQSFFMQLFGLLSLIMII